MTLIDYDQNADRIYISHDHSHSIGGAHNGWAYSAIEKAMMDNYKANLNQQLYGQNTLLNHLTHKDKTMDTIDTLVAERIRKREEARIEAAFEAFDELGFNADEYQLWTWSHVFEGRDTVFEYSALMPGNGKVYVTGRTGPDGIPVEEFVGWCVRQGFHPANFGQAL